jgi:16S rRNA G966 N2-methylase RsmD
MKLRLVDLPDTITAPRTDPVYNCHAYLTKVPIAAIQPFIEAFTEPGGTVVDMFAGSGMTGLAAAVAGRNALLGQHIANGYLTQVDADSLRRAAERATSKAREALGTLYTTKRASDGAKTEVVRTVWSFTYVCPGCSNQVVFYEAMRNERTAAPDKCPSCGVEFIKRKWARSKDVPVVVVVRGPNGRLTDQKVASEDLRAIQHASSDERQKDIPSLPIEEAREMYSRSGLGKAGLTNTKQFFSARNAIALFELWNAISAEKNAKLRAKLSFAFTAILARASRRYQWSAQRPLNAQNQTYYIAPVYYEWNIFELFDRKVEASIRASHELFDATPLLVSSSSIKTSYEIASADRLKHLADESVDYVFTDPPFGSNIFYSDMNLFHEAWLGRITDHAREAVMHTTGRKKTGAAARYEKLLRGAFAEAFRVLKPGRYMSVVFGNSDGQIWGLVQRAMREAGFSSVPVHVAILDKGQRSVKGLNSGSEGVVTVDLVVTLRKPTNASEQPSADKLKQADASAHIEQIVEAISPNLLTPSHVYVAIVRDAIRQNLMVDHLHLSDVLIALRKAGYGINPKSGLLTRKKELLDAAE